MAKSISKRKENRIRDLFFLRRFPKRDVADSWERPASDKEYVKLLEYEDFMTLQFEPDKEQKYPVVVQDLKDMDEHLLPTFFELSQKAKYFQNMFYNYQWMFIGGTFFSTILGVYTTHTFTTPEALQSLPFQVATLATSLVSAIVAAYTGLTNRRQPQRRWAQARRAAEELRMNYFLYISHLAPYNQPDRLKLLRSRVIEVKQLEEQDV